MNTLQIVRTGTVHTKAAKTDPVSQTFHVRQHNDGSIEYLHKQLLTWFDIPAEWVSKIVWEST